MSITVDDSPGDTDMTSTRALSASVFALAAALAVTPAVATAQAAHQAFSIPAQDLGRALTAYSRATGLQVAARPALLQMSACSTGLRNDRSHRLRGFSYQLRNAGQVHC